MEEVRAMAIANPPDVQVRLLRLLLAVLGVTLLGVGWYRWAT